MLSGDEESKKSILDKTRQCTITSSHCSRDENKDPFIFLQVTIVTVEVISAIFNLAIKYNSDLKKYMVFFTYLIYGVLTFLNILVIVAAMKTITKELQKTKEAEDNSENSKINRKTMVSEVLTISSTLMWIVIGLTSVWMLMNKSDKFEGLNLGLGILAPALGCISAIVRYCRDKDQENKKPGPGGSASPLVYTGLAAFECIHCVCHIIEAVQLNGKTQNIYEFNNIPVIVIQVVVGIVLLCYEVHEHFKKQEVSSDSPPSHTMDQHLLSDAGRPEQHINKQCNSCCMG